MAVATTPAQLALDTTPGDDASPGYSPDTGTVLGNQSSSTGAGASSTTDSAAQSSSPQSYPAGQGGASASSTVPSDQAAYSRDAYQDNATRGYEYPAAYVATHVSQAVDTQPVMGQQPPVRLPPGAAPLSSLDGLAEAQPSRPADKALASLLPVSRPQRDEWYWSRASMVLVPPLDAAPGNVPAPVVANQPGSAAVVPVDAPAPPAPQTGNVFAGDLPIDLAALERAANEFFARLEDLAEDMTSSPLVANVAQWLMVTAVALGASELLRAWIGPVGWRRSAGSGDDDRSWAGFPVLAVLPPEDGS
jgi:hypothetical protein